MEGNPDGISESGSVWGYGWFGLGCSGQISRGWDFLFFFLHRFVKIKENNNLSIVHCRHRVPLYNRMICYRVCIVVCL